MAAAARYHVIMVCVDLSPASRGALQHALALAEATGARVEVVHVVEKLRPTLPYSDVNRSVVMELQREMLDGAEAAIGAFLPAHPKVPIRTAVLSGDPDVAILNRARRARADLIVLSSRGHNALEELLLGSTADRVLRRSSIPVLLVPARRRRR